MSDSLQSYGLQLTKLTCPLPFPGVCSNSCPLNQWCHPTISSSVIPFSSCLQSFPASRSFLMNWLFASCGQYIGASASVLPMNIQGWFPLGSTGWISLQSKGLSRVFSNTTVQEHQFFGAQPSLPPGCPFPIKSLALSAHVSPQSMHFWVFDKNPLLGPGRGPPSCNIITDTE